jgi:hypothetical protein
MIRIYGSGNCFLPSFKEYYSCTCCDAHYERICVHSLYSYITQNTNVKCIFYREYVTRHGILVSFQRRNLNCKGCLLVSYFLWCWNKCDIYAVNQLNPVWITSSPAFTSPLLINILVLRDRFMCIFQRQSLYWNTALQLSDKLKVGCSTVIHVRF